MQPTPRRTTQVGLLCWAIQPLSLIIEVVVAATVRAPYSWLDNTISDLGARTCTTVAYPGVDVPVCSPLHGLMNASFMIGGITTALGAWLLLRRQDGRFATLPIALWTIYGLSGVLTGFVPLDVGPVLHYVVSTPAVLLGGVAVAATARLLTRRGWGGAKVWVVIGIISTLASVFLTIRLDPAWGGLLERIGIWPSAVALAVFAWAIRYRLPRWTFGAYSSARLDP
ncbi:DUF998 domain-containing protein [uncultured Friedmanniella sp.]|uniref:DUF998 domain-containing protein n=1 Tax=uncultured Friedmanniella sp. TaxID=335381 RepID=UPI0035CA8236